MLRQILACLLKSVEGWRNKRMDAGKWSSHPSFGEWHMTMVR
jgi:hypothetical protein